MKCHGLTASHTSYAKRPLISCHALMLSRLIWLILVQWRELLLAYIVLQVERGDENSNHTAKSSEYSSVRNYCTDTIRTVSCSYRECLLNAGCVILFDPFMLIKTVAYSSTAEGGRRNITQ